MGHFTQNWCDFTLRAAIVAGLIMLALLAGGCALVMPDRIHYVAKPPDQSMARCDIDDQAEATDRILGIALSGGGSRAAVFGASTLEALSEHGVLGQVSHISSVSGGSLVGSYFLAHPPACEETATREARQACWQSYFPDFKLKMRVSYQTGMFLRNAQPSRFSSPTRRATSLQEEFDKHFLDGKAFGDLGLDPVLLINATSYDETRRFVFSNACLAAGPADSSSGSNADAGKRYRIMAEAALAERALQAFTFSRPECIRPTPGNLPVSLAVVSSASFPPAIGPVSLEVPSGCVGGQPEWWHLGDGGIIENAGTDSLEEVILRRLTDGEPRLKSALILSVDAGARFDPDELKSRKNFRMYTDPGLTGLVVDSPRVRGQAYHDIFWDELADELAKEGIGYEKITFQHSQAMLDELPGSCVGKISSVGAIRDRLPEIPTEFGIDECDADLLEMAAHQLVHDTLDEETVRRLRSEGLSIHAGQDCALSD